MPRLAQIYLGGWAIIFGFALSGMASGSDSVSVLIVAANVPGRIAYGASVIWVIYTVPFAAYYALTRSVAAKEPPNAGA